jgi:hypothetical protein
VDDGFVSRLQQVTVLGATGSVGLSTLDVIARHPGRYQVFALHQVFSRDRLVTLDLDTGDGRSLNDSDDQDVAFATQLDILKEPGFEQRTSGFHQATIIRLFPDVQRQGTKDATGGNPLEAVDANIGDSEGLGVNFGDHQYGENRS